VDSACIDPDNVFGLRGLRISRILLRKPTEQELGRREAITCALILGITATVTSFLGLTGLLLTFFLVVSVLVKLYDCELANSFLMTAGSLLLPVLFFLALRFCVAG
jgi:hypothetical protein